MKAPMSMFLCYRVLSTRDIPQILVCDLQYMAMNFHPQIFQNHGIILRSKYARPAPPKLHEPLVVKVLKSLQYL